MGGIGSGRRYQVGKDTTDEYRALDVRRLHREGVLAPGCAFRWHWTCDGKEIAAIAIHGRDDRVLLQYRSRDRDGDWQERSYAVMLDWTNCHLGGRRVWFRCPALGCGRRVAMLYGGSVFACRHCHALTYQCQRESLDDRAARRAERIRQRLGWEAGILNGTGKKPKGMRWQTFERLEAQHNAHVRMSLVYASTRLGMGLGDFESMF